MTIVVLAGGLGTRIQGILGDTPKAMAPIGDEPFLEYLLLRCKSQGFQEYIVSLGHEGGKIRDYFGDGGRFGLSRTRWKQRFSEPPGPLNSRNP
jgi:D-glycero-alpha-D-manno-heptose 1-phosphate guanylyltransferase